MGKTTKLATEIAAQLRTELKMPQEMLPHHKSTAVKYRHEDTLKQNTLPPTPKMPGPLAFQRIQGQDAAKHIQSDTLSDKAQKELFCMAHNEFVLKPGVDVDHAHAHDLFRDRQIKFLLYLNKNPKLAAKLLEQDGMADYFFIHTDGIYYATNYFYKCCYNNISNLWLLCHVCNNQKNNKTSEQWLESQPNFGGKFKNDLSTQGGIQHGIILDSVYQPTGKETEINIEGEMVKLYPGVKLGVGQFIRDWYFDNHRDEYQLHKKYFDEGYSYIKDEFDELRRLVLAGDYTKSTKMVRKLAKSIGQFNAGVKAILERRAEHSTSVEQSTAQVEAEIALLEKTMKSLIDKTHHLSKIVDRLDGKWGKDTRKALISELDIDSMSGEDARKLRALVEECLQNNPSILPATFAEWFIREGQTKNQFLAKKVEKLEAENSTLKQTVADSDHRLQSQQSQLVEKDAAIRKLEAQLKSAQDELLQRDRQIQAQVTPARTIPSAYPDGHDTSADKKRKTDESRSTAEHRNAYNAIKKKKTEDQPSQDPDKPDPS